MHIVLLNQYFPPDEAPTGLMLATVALELRDMGHQVTIFCAEGGYARTQAAPSEVEDQTGKEGIFIYRTRSTRFGRKSHIGKIADYLTYYFTVSFKLATHRPKPDRIVALTTPPYLSILARLFSRIRGGDHAHWVMDLYPDVMISHGMLSDRSVPLRILRALASWGFGGSRCRMVLTLGPDMAKRTSRYQPDPRKIDWIPLWGTADNMSGSLPQQPTLNQTPEGQCPARPLVLMYSGNMGLGHRFGEFLHAAATQGSHYEWRFHGNGKRRPEVECFLAEHPEAPVTLGDYVPRAELATHLASADVHLASLAPSWDGTMVPSKLQGIFAIGKPVIFIGTEISAIGQWILQSDGGWVVAPDDHEGLARALRQARDPETRERKGEAAREFAAAFFNAKINAARVANRLAGQAIARVPSNSPKFSK